MKSLELGELSPDVFKNYRQDRLRGRALTRAFGEGHSLVVAYEGVAIRFDSVVYHMRRTKLGAHKASVKIEDPYTSQEHYLTLLKASKGVFPTKELAGTALEEFADGKPQEAVLLPDDEVDTAKEANFTPEDEERFQNLARVNMYGGAPLSGTFNPFKPNGLG